MKKRNWRESAKTVLQIFSTSSRRPRIMLKRWSRKEPFYIVSSKIVRPGCITDLLSSSRGIERAEENDSNASNYDVEIHQKPLYAVYNPRLAAEFERH
jgi:hypothetical protein